MYRIKQDMTVIYIRGDPQMFAVKYHDAATDVTLPVTLLTL